MHRVVLCCLLLLFATFPALGQSQCTTNEANCVACIALEYSTFPHGDPILVSISFQNIGPEPLLFPAWAATIARSFCLHDLSRRHDIPLSRLGKVEDKVAAFRRSPWQNPLVLPQKHTMLWACPLGMFFDTSVPGSYSLDVDIPFRAEMKADSEHHFVFTNITFRIEEPTNMIVRVFPTPPK